jgi:hypothetical protein
MGFPQGEGAGEDGDMTSTRFLILSSIRVWG